MVAREGVRFIDTQTGKILVTETPTARPGRISEELADAEEAKKITRHSQANLT